MVDFGHRNPESVINNNNNSTHIRTFMFRQSWWLGGVGRRWIEPALYIRQCFKCLYKKIVNGCFNIISYFTAAAKTTYEQLCRYLISKCYLLKLNI